MPRARKPNAVHELSGAWRHDPQRRRAQAEPVGPLGPPPRQKELTLSQAWKLIADTAPPGTLTSRDRIYVELCASLLVEFRTAPTAFHPAKLARLEMVLGKLGLNPSDASRVVSTPPPTPNEFAD